MLLCSRTIRYSLVCFILYLPLTMMGGFLTYLRLGGARGAFLERGLYLLCLPCICFIFILHICWNLNAVTNTLMSISKSSSYPKELHQLEYQFFLEQIICPKQSAFDSPKTTISVCIDLHSETVS